MLLHVTTHIEGRKHDDLLQTVGGRGFPSFFMLDAEGAVIGSLGGERSVENFAKMASRAQEFLDLRAKAEAGDGPARIDYTLRRGELGQLDREALEKELKKLGKLSPEQEKTKKGVVANLMFDEIRKTAVGERFAAMHKEGLVPGGEEQRSSFYIEIMNYAEHRKDAKLFETALEEVRKIHGNNPQAAGFFANAQERLGKLKP